MAPIALPRKPRAADCRLARDASGPRLAPAKPAPPDRMGQPLRFRPGQTLPPVQQHRGARAALEKCKNTGNGLSGLVGEQKTPPTATIAERPREQGQNHPAHRRRTEKGTDRHRRPTERTEIQREVYCKGTLSDAAHEPRGQEQPSRGGLSSVITRSWTHAPSLQRWRCAVMHGMRQRGDREAPEVRSYQMLWIRPPPTPPWSASGYRPSR
jgi:hypothetical protein